jgi:glycosyltransferase involved in cell wall biosynthesis
MKHVLVLGAQVPFVKGGAELLNESLLREINKLGGVSAELVQLPFKWYPEEQIINDIFSWRLQDFSEANGEKIDLVIPTKFPSYAAEHENKVLWLVHQHRVLYDLEGSEYDAWQNHIVRNKVRSLDTKFFKECRKIFTISEIISKRLKQYNNYDSTPLFPPPFLRDKIYPGKYKDKIIYVGRLEPNKRPDLLLQALLYAKKAKVSIIGKGRSEDIKRLMILIEKYGISDRCEILGYLPEEDLLRHLADCRALFYAPFDEDYGYATIEAFLACKPIISCDDSGEVVNFIRKTGAGFISDTNPKNIATNLLNVYEISEKELEDIGHKGYELARDITWDKILKALVLENL